MDFAGLSSFLVVKNEPILKLSHKAKTWLKIIFNRHNSNTVIQKTENKEMGKVYQKSENIRRLGSDSYIRQKEFKPKSCKWDKKKKVYYIRIKTTIHDEDN